MRACVCVCVSQPALAAANAFACACRHDRALWAQSQRHPRPRRKAASAYFTASSGARLRAWRRTSTTTTFFVKFLMRGGLFLRPQVVLALLDRRIVKKSVWPGSEPPTGHLGKGARKFVVIVVSVGPSAEPQPGALQVHDGTDGFSSPSVAPGRGARSTLLQPPMWATIWRGAADNAAIVPFVTTRDYARSRRRARERRGSPSS